MGGAESGTDLLSMRIQMLDISIGRGEEPIEIGEPFQPRPGMARAVHAQISEQVVLRQSANACAVGDRDSLRGRVNIDSGKQDRIVGGAPVQLYPNSCSRPSKLHFPAKTNNGAALHFIQLCRGQRQRVTIAFNDPQGRFGAFRRHQQIDVPGLFGRN